jgi:hypothetical protein
MVRVVLLVASIGLVLALGVLPFDLRHPAALVADVLGIGTSAALLALALVRLAIMRREDQDLEDRQAPGPEPRRASTAADDEEEEKP